MAIRGDDDGIYVNYHTCGGSANLRKCQGKTKVLQDVILYFIFADDCAHNCSDHNYAQGAPSGLSADASGNNIVAYILM